MEDEVIEKGFFRRIWYSITKIEKYPNMSAQGVGKAFSYFIGLILLVSVIFAFAIMFNKQCIEDMLSQMSVSEVQKQDMINIINNIGKGQLFISVLMASYAVFLTLTICHVFILSIFGYLVAMIVKIKMRFVAIFNMAIYSITLPTLLALIYEIVNLFIDFSSRYSVIAYIAIACIYLISAFFIIKSEFVKKQAELNQIEETQKKIKEERK